MKVTCPECDRDVDEEDFSGKCLDCEWEGIEGVKNQRFHAGVAEGKREALRALPYWISIKTQLPREGQVDLLVLDENGTIHNNVFYEAEHAAHDHSVWQTATHWLPEKELLKLARGTT